MLVAGISVTYKPDSGPREGLYMDDNVKESSAAVASLFTVLKSIVVSPEKIEQNQWKSVGKNGEVEFYY